MREMFICALEDLLGLTENSNDAPIARMTYIMLEIMRLKRVAKQRNAPVHAGQDVAFWNCSGCGMLNYDSWKTCAKCNAPHPNRPAGG